MLRLFLAFAIVPLVEVLVLVRIGQWLGAWPAVGLVLLTALVGSWLARREGAWAWSEVRSELAAGRVPGRELLGALLVLVAGVLLVTPGILTDAAGVALLVRPLRRRAVEAIRARIEVRTLGPGGPRGSARPGAGDGPDGDGGSEGASGSRGGRVIEI